MPTADRERLRSTHTRLIHLEGPPTISQERKAQNPTVNDLHTTCSRNEPHGDSRISLTLLLCCNLLSLTDGGSTTVVAGGFYLVHYCHCCGIIRHTYVTVTTEGTTRRSESETIAAVHGNRACLCPVFWARLFPLKRICSHQPLQTSLRCATLRTAMFVFSSFHYFLELGANLTASSLSSNLRRFALSLFHGHRLLSTLFSLSHCNILTPCRSLSGLFPAFPTSSPTRPTSRRSPPPTKPNTMASGISTPRLFFTSTRSTLLWTSGSMFWVPLTTRSSTRPTHSSTITCSIRSSYARSSPLWRYCANPLANSSLHHIALGELSITSSMQASTLRSLPPRDSCQRPQHASRACQYRAGKRFRPAASPCY